MADLIQDYNVEAILAVSRGGLFPAAFIAYRLNIKVIGVIPPIVTTHRKVVIVDDVCDTGHTFETLRTFYEDAHFAAMFVKPKGYDVCDVWAYEVEQDNWLVFPWARDDEINR